MMAKMFYTLEEAKAALGKSEDEIRKFARDGRLREFRDGPRLMFKADQVEQLKNEVVGGGGSGEEEVNLDTVDIGTSDSGGLIGLVDTTGASGTSITLSDADVEVGGSGLGSGVAGSGLGSGLGSSGGLETIGGGDTGQSTGGGMTMRMKDDTALAQDLGLSGSLGGVPSPGRPSGGAPTGTGLSGTSSGRAGINVFGHEDAVETVDPMAQTNISGGIRDQMALEGVGSGSGLLDLTRESDDTSLGAVLDEITPGPSPRRTPTFESNEGSFGAVMEDTPAPRAVTVPDLVEAPDALAPAFGGAALAAALITLFGIFVLISSVVGTRPPAVQWFADNRMDIWKGAGLFFLPIIIFFIGGLIIGKVTTPKATGRR